MKSATSIKTIPRFRLRDRDGKNGAEYAIRLTTEQNLEQFWRAELDRQHNTEPYVELEITARHGFSGFPVIRKQLYTEIDCIQEGQFISGDTLEIRKCG